MLKEAGLKRFPVFDGKYENNGNSNFFLREKVLIMLIALCQK